MFLNNLSLFFTIDIFKFFFVVDFDKCLIMNQVLMQPKIIHREALLFQYFCNKNDLDKLNKDYTELPKKGRWLVGYHQKVSLKRQINKALE